MDVTTENMKEIISILTDREELAERNIRLRLKGVDYNCEVITRKCYLDNSTELSALDCEYVKWFWKVQVNYNTYTRRFPIEDYSAFKEDVERIVLALATGKSVK